MHSLKWIRQNWELFDQKLALRGLTGFSDQIKSLDEKNRAATTKINSLQAERKQLARVSDKNSIHSRALEIKQEISDLSALRDQIDQELKDLLFTIPNLPLDEIPSCEPKEVRKWGNVKEFSFKPKNHFELFPHLMDFDTASSMSGSRFVILMSDLAKLERALGNFMLDFHTSNGFTEVSPPLLVKSPTMYGTCQLPKFKEDQFATDDDLWLIPTAEVSLTNLVRGKILQESQLPLRFCAFTQCFRREAGAAGKDTRGMIRLHQFSKVEMVSITTEEDGLNELEFITSSAENILQMLNLPYRTIILPANDIGFSAQKTYDIEVYLAGQDCYREISSCSYCGNIQALRMNARYKNFKGENVPVCTLNGSGLAVGRTLVALLEYYQQEDGSVLIPEVLWPYMGGQKIIISK